MVEQRILDPQAQVRILVPQSSKHVIKLVHIVIYCYKQIGLLANITTTAAKVTRSKTAMSKHTRALKQAEQDYAKATNKLEKLQIQHENMQKSLHENDQNNSEDIQKELSTIIELISEAQTVRKKAKSKVAEAEMFVMRNKY